MTDGIKDTIGCDLGDKFSDLFILTANGETQVPERLKTTQAGVKKFFSQRKPAHVVLEASTHSSWVSSIVKKLGHEVTVADTRRLRLISHSDSKSDRTDAELLARLGRADPDLKLLRPIRHRGDQAQADLAVAKSRDMLVGARTKLVNQARGLVKSFGERLPASHTRSIHRKAASAIPELLKPALQPLFKAIEMLNEQISELDKTVEQVAKRYADVEVVRQIDGVGVLTALVFLLTLDDKTRFDKSRKVGAFAGLRPRRDQSGDTDKQLPITKAGDSFLRKLLVNCANHIMGPFGKDSDLRRWGLRLAERGGKNARQRAKIAVARKLAVLMHRLWVTGEEYQAVGYRANVKV
jgi:transposase